MPRVLGKCSNCARGIMLRAQEHLFGSRFPFSAAAPRCRILLRVDCFARPNPISAAIGATPGHSKLHPRIHPGVAAQGSRLKSVSGWRVICVTSMADASALNSFILSSGELPVHAPAGLGLLGLFNIQNLVELCQIRPRPRRVTRQRPCCVRWPRGPHWHRLEESETRSRSNGPA